MLATKISSKGQLVVPKVVRDKLKIKPGTFFHIQLDNNNIILTPMEKSPVDNLYGKFEGEKILNELEKEHADEITNENRT